MFHRRLRLPLLAALFCCVFVFVIQFQANSNYTNNNNSSYNEKSTMSTSTKLNRIGALLTLSNLTTEIETFNSSSSALPPCPLVPPKLVGRLQVHRTPPPMAEMEATLSEVRLGGRYRPPVHCTPTFRVAIIVPYRDRDEHLRILLWNIHPMLMRQNIAHYGIYVVEQAGQNRFNRAKLMNIGFLEALKQANYDCFIFHDVDLIPEDDRNLYTCDQQQPRHMSVAMDKFHYRMPYADYFGGVSALTRRQFETVNGFSNEFWGWGGEDDDMANRVHHYKFHISRRSTDVARYTMLKHEQSEPSTDRIRKLNNGWRRFASDGLNSTKYEVLDVSYKKLYTWILVDLFAPSKYDFAYILRYLFL